MEMTVENQSIKCVVVGDSAVGKTRLLTSYITNAFQVGYNPMDAGPFVSDVMVDGRNITLRLFNISGMENFDMFPPVLYPKTDVFIVCFSLISRASFENARARWIRELIHHCPNTPIILVGTKLDLRDDPNTLRELEERGLTPVTHEQGLTMATEIQAVQYIECSSHTLEGLNQVFEAAIRAALRPN